MPTVVPSSQIKLARSLRSKTTDGERRLWFELRQFRKTYGLHVRRQVPIGPYVADFAIHSKRLIVELDDEFHFTEVGLERDARRDIWFENNSYHTLRINTDELSTNFTGCIETILHKLGLNN